MKRTLLFVSLCGLFSAPSWGLTPFTVKDIRVEGIQRTEAGTVFNYLPVKVGEVFNETRSIESIKALFQTGFFEDVRLEEKEGVLIVSLVERPVLYQINISGAKEFDKDQLKKNLREIGLTESRIFDKAQLELAEQELKRLYFSKGKYSVEIKSTVTKLERNRVAVDLSVKEGLPAFIQSIQFVGNQAFKDKELLDLFSLTTPGMMTWLSRSDQYAKPKFTADIEALRAFYVNRGFMDFNIDSTQVAISPDKESVYLTVNLNEGTKYTFNEIRFAGNFVVPEAELKALVEIKPGEVFSRERITELSNRISERLGNEGFAFANVNPVPEAEAGTGKVNFTFFIDAGRRIHVRRINIAGNTRTRDEVIRREMRQIEGAIYSAANIKRSKERVDLLGYFTEVTLETPAVPDAPDQVDVNLTVVEKPTGNLMLGAGFSKEEGMVLSGSISQSNIFGSGKYLSIGLNSGKLNKLYSLSFVDPYFTVDGMSLGYDIYKKNVDPSNVSLGQYKTSTVGGIIKWGIPLNEYDTIHLNTGIERTHITLFDNSPTRYIEFVNTFGATNRTLLGTGSWVRDTRDSSLFPKTGRFQKAGVEMGLPGGTIRYYKLHYQNQSFVPLSKRVSVLFNTEVGVGNGMNGRPLPFYNSFYAGGFGSVRGYSSGSVGPKDTNGDPLGGTKRVVGNLELLFPFPGMKDDKTIRMSTFFDAGAVSGVGEKLQTNMFRYSTGIGLNWLSPVGPMRFSYAAPLKAKEGDKKERFQFTLGTTF